MKLIYVQVVAAVAAEVVAVAVVVAREEGLKVAQK